MVSFFPTRHNISSAEKVWVALALATSAELSGGKIIFDTVSIIEFRNIIADNINIKNQLILVLLIG
mgnify:CR=1 FL=1